MRFTTYAGLLLALACSMAPLPTADAALIELLREVTAYPGGSHPPPQASHVEHEIAVPFRIRIGGDMLSFFSLTTVFGNPIEVALS